MGATQDSMRGMATRAGRTLADVKTPTDAGNGDEQRRPSDGHKPGRGGRYGLLGSSREARHDLKRRKDPSRARRDRTEATRTGIEGGGRCRAFWTRSAETEEELQRILLAILTLRSRDDTLVGGSLTSASSISESQAPYSSSSSQAAQSVVMAALMAKQKSWC